MKLRPQTILQFLLIFVPLAFAGKLLHWPPPFIFLMACLAITPLAGLMGRATEVLADRLGAGMGGLLNATFGNACELLIALSALRAGLIDVVKASITGSIIGNVLLVMGAAMVTGGLKYKNQEFNKTAATTSSTLLALAAICLVVPAVFHYYGGPSGQVTRTDEHRLALSISIVQFVVYLLSLIFSLKTHKNLYVREVDESVEEAIGTENWGVKTSIIVLAVTTVFVAILAEMLVQQVEATAQAVGLTHMFIGVIVVAIIGNAAEHSTAILMAIKNKMDLAINIALGSSTQIALFVAPVIVFASFMLGTPMDLCFSEFEVMAVVVSVIILPFVTFDGECNWLEGVQLLAVYTILGATFFFL
ncbi:MAG: calcium/proton exchanger [Candidatus Obscuribacterales bacterium]|nr:calcium/proton exchanger [Candidatus Obscuribacterales bacterium]